MKIFLYERKEREPIQIFSFLRDDNTWFIVTFTRSSTETVITETPPTNPGDQLVGLGYHLAIKRIYEPQVAVMQGNLDFSRDIEYLPGDTRITRRELQKKRKN